MSLAQGRYPDLQPSVKPERSPKAVVESVRLPSVAPGAQSRWGGLAGPGVTNYVSRLASRRLQFLTGGHDFSRAVAWRRMSFSYSLAGPLFPTSQHFEWMPQPLTFVDEFLRPSGIEFEHFEMAWYDQFCPDVLCQLRGLTSEQITRNASFWRAPINGK